MACPATRERSTFPSYIRVFRMVSMSSFDSWTLRIRMINDDHKPYFITHVCLTKYLYNNLFWALKQNFLQQYINNWSNSCLVSMTPTLLIPRSEIYFQTSSRGVNEAFLWAIGSDFASLAAAAYNYHKGMLIDKIKFSIFDE